MAFRLEFNLLTFTLKTSCDLTAACLFSRNFHLSPEAVTLSQTSESSHPVPSAWSVFLPVFGLDQCCPIGLSAMMMEKSLFAVSNVVASGHTCSVSSASELQSHKWLPYWAV